MSETKKRFDPNNLMIGGRLTRDPELRYNAEQKPYTVITVANKRFRFEKNLNECENNKEVM